MPWQQQVADVGLELTEDGTPAYREVVFTVPRQSGKTTVILGWTIQRALGWEQLLGAPQRIVYSAQTGADARKKLVEDQFPLLEPKKRLFGISRFMRAIGSEGVIWDNGSRLGLLASSEDSGHGKTVDLGIKDELFADVDMRRDQALIPAMATRPNAQLVTASTMGTADSVALNMKVEQGRGAVSANKRSGIAYFEWSAEPDEDPADPATWWRCMPALGRTITLEVIESAYDLLPLGEFKRAFLNIATLSEESVIPASVWNLVNGPDFEATGEMFALDLNPERSAACFVACGTGPVLEVVDYRAGVAWVVERATDLQAKFPRARFAVDVRGPAASFLPDLKRARIKLVEFATEDVTRATGFFYDQVVDEKVKIRRHEALDAAVAGAEKRTVSDAWVWGRKTSKADISPLVAATLALWGQSQRKPRVRYVPLTGPGAVRA